MHISRLLIYPVKGCGWIELEETELDAYGMKYDRNWVVVDENGRFLSQRTHPQLCLIKPRLTKTAIVLSAPGMSELALDLNVGGPALQVSIWQDEVIGTDIGDIAAHWFGRYLGQKVRVAAIGPSYSRNVTHHDYVYSAQVHFGDAFPLLVVGEASLADLNSRLEEPVPIERFRPNIVISGAQPFEEDTWCDIVVGESILRFGKPCGRCKVTTINFNTGEMGKEPLRTLSTYRNFGGSVRFGSYYMPLAGHRICVGDLVSIPTHA